MSLVMPMQQVSTPATVHSARGIAGRTAQDQARTGGYYKPVGGYSYKDKQGRQHTVQARDAIEYTRTNNTGGFGGKHPSKTPGTWHSINQVKLAHGGHAHTTPSGKTVVSGANVVVKRKVTYEVIPKTPAQLAAEHKLRTNGHQFQPGHVPANKGRKISKM